MSVQEREPAGWPEFASAVMRMTWRRMRRAVDGSSWTAVVLTGGKGEPAFQGQGAAVHLRNGPACRATELPAITPLVIIDFHTHVFPPHVREDRDGYLRRDATFAEMYASPRAEVATAEDLLRSMDEAGVDVSGARGGPPPEPRAGPAAGPAGVLIAELPPRRDLILLFHVTEPVGHDYPGKQGLRLESFYRFAVGHHQLKLVGAHLAGGLPLYAPMLAVRKALLGPYADTAALRYLYEPSALPAMAQGLGGE